MPHSLSAPLLVCAGTWPTVFRPLYLCVQGHAPQAMLKVMSELRQQEGLLDHLQIGPKIGEGGYGVVHAGEGKRGQASMMV